MDESRVTTQMSHPDPAALDETGRAFWRVPNERLLSGRQFPGGTVRPTTAPLGEVPYAPTRELPFAFREGQDGDAFIRPAGGRVDDSDNGLLPGSARASAASVFGMLGSGPTGPVNDGHSFGKGRNVARIPVHRQGLGVTFARGAEGVD